MGPSRDMAEHRIKFVLLADHRQQDDGNEVVIICSILFYFIDGHIFEELQIFAV